MGQRREAWLCSPGVPKIYHLHTQDAAAKRSGEHSHNSEANHAACYLLIVPTARGLPPLDLVRGAGPRH